MTLIYHRPPLTPAHRGNSRRGIMRAYYRHAWGIDIDMLMGRGGDNDSLYYGPLYGCHWQCPCRFDWFRDPDGEVGRNTRLRDMSPEEVARLRTPKWAGAYKISTVKELMRFNLHAAEQRKPLHMCFEVKPDPRFAHPGAYHRLFDDADKVGHPREFIRVMTQPRGGLGLQYAEAAKAAGAKVILLRRGRVSKEWMTLLGPDDRIKHGGKLWTPEQVVRRGL